jgi:hypothetical protein
MIADISPMCRFSYGNILKETLNSAGWHCPHFHKAKLKAFSRDRIILRGLQPPISWYLTFPDCFLGGEGIFVKNAHTRALQEACN